MSKTTKAEGIARFNEYRAMCNGSLDMHRHPLGALIYSDGVSLLAEVAGAHWLIDLIASWQWTIRHNKAGGEDFQVWIVKDCPTECYPHAVAVECWSDTPDKSTRLAYQHVEYSDFPRELCGAKNLRLYVMRGERMTLMLPEEW